MEYYLTKENGEKIMATPERWCWGILYKNHEELKQFGDDGIFHQVAEIDHNRIEMFTMYKLEDMGKRIDLLVEGKQIFHFYRQTVFNARTPEERKVTVYVFGWKNKDTKEVVYHYILPDDRMVISDKDIDITKFNL